MARTLAQLPPGSRITDYISLGVLARRFSAFDGRSRAASKRQGRPPSARFTSAGDGLLRDRLGVVHAGVLSRSVALPAGGTQLAAGRPPNGPPRPAARASRGPVSGWGPSRCANCTTSSCGRSRAPPAAAAGTGGGGWSRSTAAFSTSPMSRATCRRSGARGPHAAPAPIPNCASCRWWKTARTCCSALAWELARRVKSPWPGSCCRR